MITFKEKSPETKKLVSDICSWAAIGLAAVYFVLLAFGGLIFGKDSLFYRSINLFSGAGDYNVPLRIISIVFFVLTVSLVLRLLLDWIATFMTKGKAFINLTVNIIRCVAVIVIIFMILKVCGVDTVTLLAGVGIIGLIVGLAAQPLIEDILAGLFIVFEGVFEVGDMIVYDEFRGEIKEIGVRTTQIIDWGGNIKVVNNSDLRAYVNLSSKLSVAVCEVDIEYGESIERVEKVINANLDKIKQAIPAIVNGPTYCGVSALGASGVTLMFIADCAETSKYSVQRALNREIKLMFDKNDINIPFTQIVLHQADDSASEDNAPAKNDK